MSRTPLPQHPDGRTTKEQPKWRHDFPIDVAQDEYVSRRDFTKFLVLISGAMVVAQASLVVRSLAQRSGESGEPLALARDDEIARGQVLRFDYPEPGERCLLARLDDGKLVAYQQECTHLTCAVTPDIPNGRFLCPCHHGSFDATNGEPLAGPPRRPLPRIHLKVLDGVIYATGLELRT